MKRCNYCGADMRDDAKFCPVCGKADVQNDDDEKTSIIMPDTGNQNTGTQPYAQGYAGQEYVNRPYAQGYTGQEYANQAYAQGYAGREYVNQAYAQGYTGQEYANQTYAQGYTGQGYENQQYTQNYAGQNYGTQQQYGQEYADPNYANQAYAYQNYAGQDGNVSPQISKKEKKAHSKKPWIIGGICLAVVVAAVVILVLFRNVFFAKQMIKSRTEDYVDYIEDLRIVRIAETTVPKKLIKEVAADYMKEKDYDRDDIEDFKDSFDRTYDDYIDEAENELEDEAIDIEFEDFEVESVKHVNVQELIEDFYSEMETDNIEGYTASKVYSLVKEKAKEYGINLNRVYRVDADFDLSLQSEGYSTSEALEELQEEGIDTDHMFDHFYAYEYDGEYYIIPSVEDMIAPALKSYIAKAALSEDITSASSIYYAVNSMMSSETCYTDFSDSTLSGEYILVTDAGLQILPESVREEFLSCMNNELPKLRYTKNGYKDFAFKIDLDSWGSYISVYVTDGTDYVELYPDSYNGYGNYYSEE